jgi:hypothetical protein
MRMSVCSSQYIMCVAVAVADKHHVQVNEICNAAGKELAIESGIQKIRDTWTSLLMELFPYTKGEVSRGFILKGTDDITTAIDENMTALQVRMLLVCGDVFGTLGCC